jgi:DNA-binding GntR family transcriptional regulator
VESWPRVGTRVRIPTPQDVRGNYVIREALESQSARLFAEKASPAERVEMMKLAGDVDTLQADPQVNFFDFFSVHERFHRRLAECSGCPALVQAIEKTNTLIRTWQYAAISDYREMPTRYHEKLIETMSTGSAEEADRAMRAHVRNGMEEVLHRLEPYFHADTEVPLRPQSRLARGRAAH